MKKTALIYMFLVVFLFDCLAQTSEGKSYMLPDIGTPGYATKVEIISKYIPFSLSPNDSMYFTNVAYFYQGTTSLFENNPTDIVRVVCLNPADNSKVTIGPLCISWQGQMISTHIFVHENVSPNSHDWQLLNSQYKIPIGVKVLGVTQLIDTFYILQPQPAISSTAPTITIGSGGSGAGKRSPRGAMVLEGFSITGTGQDYSISTLDCDPNLEGNQGYLPITIISLGNITIGPNTVLNLDADFKNAGPGGGGGGAGSKNGDGGHGFTSGGFSCTPPPFDSTTVWNQSGESTGKIVASSQSNSVGLRGSYSINGISGGLGRCDQGGGGGTGHPLGFSGAYGEAYSISANNPQAFPGMYGGGSAGGEINLAPDSTQMPFGGGGGGNATIGEKGEANYNSNGGNITGNHFIIPFGGGSGGGAGNVWSLFPGGSGGGGGGGIALYSYQQTNIGTVTANGGDGGNGYVPYPSEVGIKGASGGGGGSGGNIVVGAKINHTGANTFEVDGGHKGLGDQQDTIISHDGGNGGSGRIRIDGPYQNLNNLTDSSTLGIGPSTEYTNLVNQNFTLTGTGNGSPVRIYIKSEGGNWYLASTTSSYTGSSWSAPLSLDTATNAYYVVALQENLNNNNSLFIYEPKYVLSQVASNILHINKPPVAYNDVVVVIEGDTVDIDVLANDIDPYGGTLSTTILTYPAHGTALVLPNNEVQYFSDSLFFGPDTIQLLICDGLACDTSYIFITVIEYNDPPVTQSDFVITDEDFPVTIDPLANDFDPDPLDTLVISGIISGPFHGTYQLISDSTIEYTPDPNYFGQDYLIYEVCNTLLYPCATDTVFITINPQNDTPVAFLPGTSVPTGEITTSTLEDQAITFCFDFFDLDGDLVSISSWTNPNPHGTVLSNQTDSICITWLPDPNFTGIDTIIVIFCDDNLFSLCDTVLLIIDVIPVNDAPLILDPLTLSPADTIYEIATSSIPQIICIETFDVDNDTVIITNIGFLQGAGNGSLALLSPGDTCFMYTSDTLFAGTDTVLVIVSDGTVNDTALVVITVIPYNNAPLVIDPQGELTSVLRDTTWEEQFLEICLNMYDVDGHNVSIQQILSVTGWGLITDPDTLDNCFLYTPLPGTLGPDTVEVLVCDDGSPQACTTIQIFIEVIEVNDPPQILQVNNHIVGDTAYLETPEDTPLQLCFDVFDEEYHLLYFHETSLLATAHGDLYLTANPYDTCIVYTPNTNFNGIDTLIIIICDFGSPSLCDEIMIIVTVAPVNDPPIANDILVKGYMNKLLTIDLTENVYDPDDELDVMSYFILDSSSNGTVENHLGVFEYTPNRDYLGNDTIVYNVCDDDSLCDEAFIYIIIDYDIFFPNAFSPNGDGINDFFEILGLENYNDAFGNPFPNKFTVYNRWGGLVFSLEGYNNNMQSLRWEGQSNTSLKRTVNSEKLPEGTYYYYFTIKNTSIRKSSFVILKY